MPRARRVSIPHEMYARALAIVLLGAAPATAQSEAASLIDQGLTMREEGRDADALALFERAYELEPSAEASAQLGFVHQALGHWEEADRYVSAALEMDDAWVERHRSTLVRSRDAIRAHLPADRAPEPRSRDLAGPGAVIGLSAAALIAGIVLLAIGVADISALMGTPPETRLWSDVASDRDRAYALEGIGGAAIGLGAIGVSIGVAWIAGGESNVAATARVRARW